MTAMSTPGDEHRINAFLTGKSEQTLALYHCFIDRFSELGDIVIEPTKTMIGISNSHKRIAWVTQLGRNFIHVVFPFKHEYADNLCFKKVGWVPGQNQCNHHFRMLSIDDLNEEVLGFMRIAYNGER
jgi:hypothetical protein